MTAFGHLADRLDAVAEELDDASFELLREAVAEGETARPRVDRRLMQARRAIEKAAGILRDVDDTDSGPARDSGP